MNYNNPFRIFSEEESHALSISTLSVQRKKCLLLFQLSDKSYVNLNGYDLDKNGVVEVVDDLKSNFDIHKKIFDNKYLYSYLNSWALKQFPAKDQIAEFSSDFFVVSIICKSISQSFLKLF